MICAWDLNLDLTRPAVGHDGEEVKPSSLPATAFRQQVQAHTHWINDVALADNNQALVSASSDITVKLWRPCATDRMPPQTIGLHSDYVKTLAVPSLTSDWVASGGLDRKICLWDLSGAGQKLSIDVGSDENGSLGSKEKGSVYALAATTNTVASGGPESTVRVWDTRSAQRITKLAGHTDNIRDILVSQDGTTILTASSDQTVKVWSTLAGRCMFTLTMHDASVWSLFSSHPDLSIFYSSDRFGLIAKTDTRNVTELDEGLCVAVAQEHEGVHKIKQAGDFIWTATSRPSISRWRDVNTDDADIDIPANYTIRHPNVQAAKLRHPSSPGMEEGGANFHRINKDGTTKRKIPLKHILRLSNTVYFPTPLPTEGDKRSSVVDRGSTDGAGAEAVAMLPVRNLPDFSVEGQTGLIKHVMLNDRRRVLTTDTAGEVVMWDLLECVPIQSFGKRHLEDVKNEIVTNTSVTNWCAVNTRTGNVAVVLEENTAFDAEMYADELDLDDDVELREDQRINLGKWVLRYLFSGLIDEEMKRDEVCRRQLLASFEEKKMQRENAPTSIQMPQTYTNGWHQETAESADATPRAVQGVKPTTPGWGISLATPAIGSGAPLGKNTSAPNALTPPAEEDNGTHKPHADRDYFSTNRPPNPDIASPGGVTKAIATPSEAAEEATTPVADGTPTQPPSSAGGKFGKKFSMRGMSFSGIKKIGWNHSNDKDKVAVQAEKDEVESDSRSAKTENSRVVDDNLLGTVQKVRYGYEDSLQQQVQTQQAHANGLPVTARPTIELPPAIVPSQPSETPVLRIPPETIILIQEERPEAGGVADLFEGTVGALAESCDIVEKVAPMWLGDVLLRNQIPQKDIVKVSFVLEPFEKGGLPSIATDGNNRLNANRMLRAKKVLAYVAERIEPPPEEGEVRPKAEDFLELWCHNQVSLITKTIPFTND